jgi:hypothetical protein
MDPLPRKSATFRPRMRPLALEPRILFDGAAGVAVEQQAAEAPAPEAAAPAAEAPPRTLVLIDTRLNDYQRLMQQAAAGAEVILADASQDGLAAISERLAASAPVASIQILSHGAVGQFTLGSQTVSADNVAALSDTLRTWAPQLAAGADILIYGCQVGAGDAGRALVDHLAELTGADVAASDDDTGKRDRGWRLASRNGERRHRNRLHRRRLCRPAGRRRTDCHPLRHGDRGAAWRHL